MGILSGELKSRNFWSERDKQTLETLRKIYPCFDHPACPFVGEMVEFLIMTAKDSGSAFPDICLKRLGAGAKAILQKIEETMNQPAKEKEPCPSK